MATNSQPGAFDLAVDAVQVLRVDVEAVGAVFGVDGAIELAGAPVLARQDAAALVRRLFAGVGDDLFGVATRQPEHRVYALAGLVAAQMPVERYFQPPSPTRRTKLPRSHALSQAASGAEDGPRGDAGEDALAARQLPRGRKSARRR